MSKQFFFILALFFVSQSNAQRLFDNSKDFDIFHDYTRWGIQLDGLGYFPAKIDNPNAFSFQSQISMGYHFGAVYNFNINNHFGFKIGAIAGQSPAINTYFVLDKTDINTTTDYEHKQGANYGPMFNYGFPLLLEYRNFTIDRYILSFNAGIHVYHTSAAILGESYQNYYQTIVSNPGEWTIDMIGKIGWYFQFKPLMLQTSIVYKHRLHDQYVGTYSFQNLTNSPSVTGSYRQSGDYIGLSFNFYFHKRSREVDMGCRANTQSAQVKKRQERARKEKEKARKRQEKMKKKKEKAMRQKAKKKWLFW